MKLSPRRRRPTSIGWALACGAILLSGCVQAQPSAATESPAWTSDPTVAPLAGPTRAPTRATPRVSDAPATQAPSSADERAPYGYATRLVIPFLEVDLPVIAGVMDAEGNPRFPPCDVALYLPYYVQPGANGTTYLYAHAREGMLLTMLEHSKVDGGAALVGKEVFVHTADGSRHDYSITIVRAHATDYSIADDLASTEQRLVLQTSEGRVGDPFKLQVAARPVAVDRSSPHEAVTSPRPRDCGPAATP
jgi:Sortase domain